MTPTILQAIADPNLLGSKLTASASWKPWKALLAATFGLPMDDEALALYRQCTGRAEPPGRQVSEAWLCIGRRGGKSHLMALLAVYAAAFRDYTPHLADGERATIAVIAADRKQARTIVRFIRGMFSRSQMLSALLEREVSDAFDLANRTSIEVMTCSSRTTRGYSIPLALCDELAFWATSEGASEADTDVLEAIRPAQASIPGSMLVCASSPYSRKGALWNAYRTHYGQSDPDTLVWQAPSKRMNPTISDAFLDRAFQLDPASAEAEYNAQFRSDIEAYISLEAIGAVVAPGRRELAPSTQFKYFGFTDPSGGGQDSYCLAVAHLEGETIVLDNLRELRPPLDPSAATAELAQVARSYGLHTVTGDRYGGQWPAERWRSHGVTYKFSEKSKSDLYGELLPLINAGRIELLDNPRLVNQLAALERRTVRGSGKDTIDHPIGPNYHDDLSNVTAGVCGCATRAPSRLFTGSIGFGPRRDEDEAALARLGIVRARTSYPRPVLPRGTGSHRGGF